MEFLMKNITRKSKRLPTPYKHNKGLRLKQMATFYLQTENNSLPIPYYAYTKTLATS
jgi:hypothetical protein